MDWFGWLIGIDRARLGDGADVRLDWRSGLDAWVVYLLLLPGVVGLAWWLYRRDGRHVGFRARAVLAALRAAIVLLVVALLCQPRLSIERSLSRRSYVLFLVDASLSMTFRDRLADPDERKALAKVAGLGSAAELDNLSRIDLVNRVLADPGLDLLKTLEKRLRVQAYAFATRPQLVYASREAAGSEAAAPAPAGGEAPVPAGWAPLEAKGTLTAVGNALQGARTLLRGQSLAAVVLVSDGRSNHGEDPLRIAQLLGDQRIPVYTVAPGTPRPPRDLELAELQAPDVALARDSVDLTLRIRQTGFGGSRVELKVWEKAVEPGARPRGAEGEDEAGMEDLSAYREAASRVVEIPEGKERVDVTIPYRAEKPGEYRLVIAAEEHPEELVRENNRIRHHLTVVDEKIRVLFVDGYPRWDYRYLKNALVRDHTVVVQVLLQSSDDDFPQEGTPGAEPLRGFPGSAKELFQYDVVILGDADPRALESPSATWQEALENLRTFADEFGGGVCFVAGPRHDPGAYRDTPLAALLPVVLPADAGRPDLNRTFATSFKYKLSPEGRDHPIVRLEEDPDRNAELWEDNDGGNDGLPGQFWFHRADGLKPGATALVLHPSERDRGNRPVPLVAVQPYGRGRTMFVGFDDSWRWRHIVGDRWFYRFWRQGVTWLRRGRLTGSRRFEVRTDKARYTVNDGVKVAARAYDPNFKPLEEPRIRCVVECPDGGRRETELEAVEGRPGEYAGALRAEAPTGAYRIWIGDEDDEKNRGWNRFQVEIPNREYENPTMDEAALQDIARRSGGAYFPLARIGELPEKIQSLKEYLSETQEEDLWDSPLAFLLFTLLITAEWILRKAVRLL